MDWLRPNSRRHVDYEWRNRVGWRHVRIRLERRNRPRKYQWGNFEPFPVECQQPRFDCGRIGVGRGWDGQGCHYWQSVRLGQQLRERWKDHGQWRPQRVL